jgi:long-chain acyl-CoA synthetase
MQNQWKWIATAIGAFWAGATLVPLDYKLTAKEQLELLAHSRARVLVTEHHTWKELVAEPRRDVLEDVLVIVTEAPGTAGADELGRALRWEASFEGELRHVERTREDVACIVYSSGTGGAPKGCMLTHDSYLEQAQILGRLYPIGENDRYFSVIPTNHAIDFMVGFLLPLYFGAAIVHQRTLRPQFLRATMKSYGITHMSLVPTILKALERRIRDRLDDLPGWQRRLIDGLTAVNETLTKREPNHALSRRLLKPIHDEFGGKLKLMFCGGAFVDRASAEFFYRLGLPVVIGYGLTEASTVVSVNDLKPFRGDTVGPPVPGVEVEIRDKSDAGIGEVWVRGRTVMKAYLDEPELTSETIVDGWLRTGDLGTIDAAGHLKLVGRKKNMIVTEGGKNVYPEDIEAAFEDVDDCEEQCVFAADYLWPSGRLTGERLVVVLRPKDEKPSQRMLEQLRARNRKLPGHKRVAGYVVWDDEFPRTASLKLKRNILRDQIAARLDRESHLVEL